VAGPNDSIPVIDAATGAEISRGLVPPWTVAAVFSTRPREFTGGTYGLPCALVIKHLNPGERHDKAAINDTLRTLGVAL
jgi:2,3,4,5-tetrahydropyridine-2,6-dicarboxylate N-succinyltransferase